MALSQVIRKHAIAARTSALLLFSLAALAAIARGGIALRAQSLACAGAALVLALAAFADRRRTPRLPLLALAPLLVFAMAAIQCLPLPASVLGLIAPLNAQLRFFPPAPPSPFAPLTLDLPATASQLAPAFAIACAFSAAVILAQRPRAQLLLLAAPIFAALIQLGICFVRLAGEGYFAGTFVNRNHLAALLVLGALASMGAALSPPREPQAEGGSLSFAQRGTSRFLQPEPGMLTQLATSRPLWIASAIACAAGVLLTLSRGAAVSLIAGAIALFLLERRANSLNAGKDESPRGMRRKQWRVAWLLLPLALAAGTAFLLTSSSLTARFQELGQRPLSADMKLRSFAGALEVALDHPLFGVGRGAWRFAAERHRSVPGEMAFIYVENEPLQLAAEEGFPLALAVLLLAIFGWLRAARAASGLASEHSFVAGSGLSRGALAGVFAVALQNLVDFNLSLPGVALPFAVALGAAAADERVLARDRVSAKESESAEPRGWRRIPRWLLAAMLPLGIALASLPILLAPWSAEREAARLVFEARDATTTSEVLLADAEATVARHPADWLVSLAPAIGLHQRSPRRTAEALAWAGRAQLLGPLSWRPHVVASAILLRAGRPLQARIEAHLAFENLGGLQANEPIELAIASSQTLDDLLEATPDDPTLRARVAMQLRVEHKPVLARALLEHELSLSKASRSPESDAALLGEEAELFREQHRYAAVEQVALQLPEASCDRALLLAEARRALGRSIAEIEQPLLHARALCPLLSQIPDQLIHGRIARRDLAGARELLDDPALADSALPFAVQVHQWRAELLEASSQPALAMHERWLAALLAPEDSARALDYAERLRSQGDLAGALTALRTLSTRATIDARAPIESRIAELEKLRGVQRRY